MVNHMISAEKMCGLHMFVCTRGQWVTVTMDKTFNRLFHRLPFQQNRQLNWGTFVLHSMCEKHTFKRAFKNTTIQLLKTPHSYKWLIRCNSLVIIVTIFSLVVFRGGLPHKQPFDKQKNPIHALFLQTLTWWCVWTVDNNRALIKQNSI